MEQMKLCENGCGFEHDERQTMDNFDSYTLHKKLDNWEHGYTTPGFLDGVKDLTYETILANLKA